MLDRIDFGANLDLGSIQDYLSLMTWHGSVVRTDSKGIILEVNDSFCKTSGYTREELIGSSHQIISSGIHPPAFWADLWNTIRRGKIWQGEICNRSKFGTLYWVRSTIAPLFDGKGQIQGYLAQRTNITRERFTAILLEAERHALQMIAGGADLAEACQTIVDEFSAVDPRMSISVLAVSKEGTALKNIAAHGLSSAYLAAIDGVEIGPTVGSCGAAAAKNEPVYVDDILSHPNWSDYIELTQCEALAACWSVPVRCGSGEVVGTVAVYHKEPKHPSTLELQLLEAAASAIAVAFKADQDRSDLVEAKERAEELAEVRRLFIANMNHEMRTPLNQILGFAQLTKQECEDKNLADMVQAITLAGEDLMGKIEKAIEISASYKSVEREIFDVADFWKTEMQSTVNAMNAHNGRKVDLDVDIPTMNICFSKRSLKKALLYVVDNAFKFTGHESSVRIKSRISPERPKIELFVEDDGPGIDPAFLEQATSAFEMEDPSFTRKHGGMGLGLAAASALMRQSSGKLRLESTEGTGTIVTLEMPMALS